MSKKNTGDMNTGNWNTGNRNTGNWNTGNRNTGNRNTGDRNTGNWNTGNRNIGDMNTGNWNTGNRNIGDMNTGNRNTGNWNTGNWNTGYMNTGKPPIRIFNKEIDIEENKIEFPNFFYFNLTEWIEENDMTNKEKEAFPSYVTTEGYLKYYNYKQAFRNSWDKASKEDRKKVENLPNFNADIFNEISGIRINDEEDKIQEAIKFLESKGRLKNGKILS